ncbi:hypothetical protein CEE37_12825 [candidate division LCP-89 bacterium B3_LCP]|uniref:DUF6249 domain-containing protein n=1 Tax=candidate division LCP-89 bacterium B3_LCP TaxID=2012998 RepID=A0A532UUE7_UNCL8|nr:MAG: hypothetical protein CEE37_12825 [candidate division LCP-89 bacterium B3_LCP]
MEIEKLAMLIPIIGVLLPAIFILAGLVIAIAAFRHRAKRNQLEHQERMLALEKGVALPEAVMPPARQSNPYFWGIVMVAFGLALLVGYAVDGAVEFIIWGAIFLFVGAAVLTANLLNIKHRRERDEKLSALSDNTADSGSA